MLKAICISIMNVATQRSHIMALKPSFHTDQSWRHAVWHCSVLCFWSSHRKMYSIRYLIFGLIIQIWKFKMHSIHFKSFWMCTFLDLIFQNFKHLHTPGGLAWYKNQSMRDTDVPLFTNTFPLNKTLLKVVTKKLNFLDYIKICYASKMMHFKEWKR